MTTPNAPDPGIQNNSAAGISALIEAVNHLAEGNAEIVQLLIGTNTEIGNLAAAARSEAVARNKKVDALTKLTYAIIASILIVIFVAVLNLRNTTQTNHIAGDTKQTNDLLLGCFTPGSECQKQSQAAQDAQLEEVRKTVYVLFICSRLTPANPDKPDPTGQAARLTKCVQSYYPNFRLPQKVNPTATPTTLLPTPSAAVTLNR